MPTLRLKMTPLQSRRLFARHRCTRRGHHPLNHLYLTGSPPPSDSAVQLHVSSRLQPSPQTSNNDNQSRSSSRQTLTFAFRPEKRLDSSLLLLCLACLAYLVAWLRQAGHREDCKGLMYRGNRTTAQAIAEGAIGNSPSSCASIIVADVRHLPQECYSRADSSSS